MYIIYNFLVLCVCCLFVLPYFLYRCICEAGFTTRMRQSLGGLRDEEIASVAQKDCIWIHGASVGEIVATSPLVKEIRKAYPDSPILVSAVTVGGYNMAKQIIQEADAIIYFPLDMPFVSESFVKRIQPRIFMPVETELWPNFLRAIRERNIPVMMVNGRISEKSVKTYRYLYGIWDDMLNTVSRFCMQSSIDADYISHLGADPKKIYVTGNTKFDQTYAEVTPEDLENYKKELGIENVADQRSSVTLISLKPEPIPLNLKVILIGNSNIYQTLLAMDSDFRKLFKIKVEFEESAEITNENVNKLAQIIHGFCEHEGLPHLDRDAMARLVEYASKLAGSHSKISTRFDDLIQVVGEAATWAKISRSKIVTRKFIDKALSERIERVKKYDEKYLEMIKENSLLINTSGYEVGELNGLTVLTVGDYTFGKPAKITVNTYTGKSNIVNIEREVEISGPSHSKGVLILTGYLGEMFAQDIPLCLTASICFEQLYNGVDGDSASSTELYGLLSSLSGIPINQSIAVTGSVNQKGQIQPIGGVNEKIEGYFQVCKVRGLDGSHGVMIPVQNVDNLQLSDEIIQAVKDKKFHIYSVSSIEEGIEVLTGVPAGKKDKDGHFPAGTVNYLVYEKLKKYAKVSYEK